MKTITKLNKWANKHNPFYLLDVLRWFLGAFLFYKGISFMNNQDQLLQLITPQENYMPSMIIYHYVTMAHFSGGILIILGLLTRLAIAVQIPILIGAILVNFIGIMYPQNLILASIILALSVFFIVVGSGKHSADYGLKMQM